ncbi:MAG: hypothetical protein M3Z24_03085, partial [Chloroflexota bacterium]|nr:hypothetical protein [Chloroflexota bacterium]
MKTYSLRQYKRLSLTTGILLLLLFTLAACGGGGNSNNNNNSKGTPSSNGTPSKGNNGSVTPTPGIKLGVQPCPDAVKDPAHWDSIAGTQQGVTQVGKVSCGNLIGTPSLQALVQVYHQGTGQIEDVHVYSNITSATPNEVFKLTGLYKGDAKISNYNTLMTGEVDTASKINSGQSNASYQLDLFREFKWSDSAGTMVQVAFPGMFPDLTRFGAEKDQDNVNNGQDQWKKDAKSVAQNMAMKVLGWTGNFSTNVISGGGDTDSSAVIKLQAPVGSGAGSVTMNLDRLE